MFLIILINVRISSYGCTRRAREKRKARLHRLFLSRTQFNFCRAEYHAKNQLRFHHMCEHNSLSNEELSAVRLRRATLSWRPLGAIKIQN